MGANYVETVYDFDPSALIDDVDVDASAGASTMMGDGTIAESERKAEATFENANGCDGYSDTD